MVSQFFAIPELLLGNEYEKLYSALFAMMCYKEKIPLYYPYMSSGFSSLRDLPFYSLWDSIVIDQHMDETVFGYPAYYVRSASDPYTHLMLMGMDEHGDVLIFNDMECGRYQIDARVMLLYRPMEWQLSIDAINLEIAKNQTDVRPIPFDFKFSFD